MMGLEPTTFCMARNERKTTAHDKAPRYAVSVLVLVTPAASKRQRNLTRNLTHFATPARAARSSTSAVSAASSRASFA
jgi:hypothetical protein